MICDEGVSALTQWKRQLLESIDLSVPDGRPLYAYRLSEPQFDSLETVLKDEIRRYSTLGGLSQSSLSFSPLFVLFAAEWWRRRHDGSRWSWEPILADLGACNVHWSAGQRGECVSKGLRYWKLRESDVSGLRYLGAIAVQGGLPMHLLAEAKGNLGRMLRKVLKLAAGGAGFREIRGWIESLNDSLPKSYQREEIYLLLAEVITTVLSLKSVAKLTKSADAVTQLDQRVPRWRERFPLPVEDDEVQGLIEQLIRDVTEDQGKRAVCSLAVEHLLERQDAEIWKLRSNIVFPEILTTQEIHTLFDIDESDDLPRSIEFDIESSGEQRAISARRVAGHDSYRLKRCPCEFMDQMAMGEHRFSLRTTDGRCWSKTLRKGEPLDSGLPWIFEQMREGSPRLVRQGGGSVQAVEVLVAIPCGWKAVAGTGTPCLLKAFIDAPDREVYAVKGDAIITDHFGHRWTIRTGQADATEESFQWSGDRMWIEFIHPAFAFRGKPGLHMIYGEESVCRVQDHRLTWKPSGIATGPVEVSYTEGQELRYRAHVVLLPGEAKVELAPEDVNRGTIRLHLWKAVSARLIDNSEAEMRVHRDGDSLLLICSSHNAMPPEWLDVEVVWEGNTTPARVRLPFPAEGARAFDATGADLAEDSWLSVQRLEGVRLVSFCRSHIPVEMILQLRHTKERKNEQEIRHRIQPVAGVSRLEIRLQDYAEGIQQLLAADELLDAWVEVALYLNNRSALSIRVSRYACRLERLSSEVFITSQHLKGIAPAVLESLPVHALRLEHPADEAVLLSCQKSQGVPTGAWDFDPGSKEPGAWLIYPGAESGLAFRPTLWLVTGDSKASTPLANALAIENREERAIAMDSVIATMAADFCDPSWGDLEKLTSHLGHLPLATLDVWRRFAHSPDGMAALALRMSNLPSGFLRRFAVEQPLVWETLPLQSWVTATQQLKVQSKAWFGDELGQRQLEEHLCTRVKEISAFSPALGKLLGIAKSIVLEDNCKEVAMMQLPATDNIFKEQLYDGENSPLRRLFRDRADDEWPSDTDIFYAIKAIREKHETSHLFVGESYKFKDTAMGLPILLAIQVATNSTDDWFDHPERIHTLRTYMAFDQEWFTEAFDLTIARCLSTGVMQLQEFNNGSA